MSEDAKYKEESAVLAEKVQARLKERAKEQHRGRTEAVLELKANTEKAFADLCGKNEKRNADAAALAETQAREFQDLLAAGKNPYEVFRSREIAARAAKKVAAQKKKIKETEMAIAAHMVQEAALNQKRDEVDKRHADYVRKYQKELGRKVVEDRTRDYMISRTGRELVDPTGRTFRIDPSQVTVMKDHTFGLGKSSVKTREQRDKVIDMVAAKPEHAGVQINPRGLPKVKEKQVSNQTSEPEALLLPPLVDPPGKDMANLHGVQSTSTTKSDTHLPSLTADPTAKKGFGVPKRSKLEEAMRLKALAKQKENMIEKQIVWRKEFVGRAFLADPDVLWFKDFDVDRPQTLRFTLTNVSNTFNHFKLLPLADDIRDFFDVKYELPGRMSAGMTCSIQVTFCARLCQDIEAELPAVAKTGYFSIPIKCTAKRSVPILSAYSLSYTNIVVGETSKQVITLRNEGALPATFRVELMPDDAFPNSPPRTAEDVKTTSEDIIKSDTTYASEEELLRYATSFGQYNLDKSMQTIKVSCDGKVDPYSSCPIAFTFAPQRPIEGLSQTFKIIFDTPSNVDPIEISVMAQAVQVPLYVEVPVMDFQCCVYDKLYRNKLILRNRGKVAMKCQLKVPSYLSDCVEFLPNFGYVQGGTQSENLNEPGRFEVQIKFRPQEKIWPVVLKKRFGWKDADIIAIPIQVLVPDQVLPVYFVLRAQLTPGHIQFSSTTLEFGSCYTTQSICQELLLTNPSRLPQKFGFVHVPPEMRVEPNDGFGTLLPFESTPVRIYYSPLSATEFRSSLTCSSTMNKTYHIPCEGRGVVPPLKFSDTVITMGAVPVGQFALYSITCTNTTASTQNMEIALPPEAAKVLHIRPLVASIPAYKSIRIELEFRPTDVESFEKSLSTSLVQFQASQTESVPGLSHSVLHEKRSSDYTWSYNLPSEPPSYHGTFNVVSFVSGDTTKALLSLQINVSVIEPIIVPKPDAIDFGQVAVGQTGVLKLHVVNNSPLDLDLKMSPLHCVGPFSIINALRTVPGGGGFRTIIVEFAPSSPLIFREQMTIQTSQGNVSVSLLGEGVSPVLSITPSDGKINFKPVLAREKGFTEFSLLNSSQFPLNYSIKQIGIETHPNFNQINVFSCIPSEASIPPGETQVVRAIFSPDHERPFDYETTFRVDVPNQTEDHVIVLKGRCWECQTYILPPSSVPEINSEDIFELPFHISAPPTLLDFTKKPQRVIQVQFDTEAQTKNITIGSIGPQNEDGHAMGSFSDGKSNSGGTFEITFDASNGISLSEKYRKYFNLEPLKGAVNPGHETQIAIHFNPNVDEAENRGSELRILHWIRVTARITLKGGYIPPAFGQQEQVIHLILKARVLT